MTAQVRQFKHAIPERANDRGTGYRMRSVDRTTVVRPQSPPPVASLSQITDKLRRCLITAKRVAGTTSSTTTLDNEAGASFEPVCRRATARNGVGGSPHAVSRGTALVAIANLSTLRTAHITILCHCCCAVSSI